MNIPHLGLIDCTHKKVLLRADCNVTLDQLDNDTEAFRLTLLKDSVDYILSFPGSSVTLVSHFGRPEGKYDEKYSLRPLTTILEKVLGHSVEFIPDVFGTPYQKEARVKLLENIRFHKEEEENDRLFAKKLSFGYDLYVNEAFSVSHRAHASVEAITEFLPSVAGLHLLKEIEELTEALVEPSRPAVVILGGNKIETKLRLINVFIKNYDKVLLGGRLANEALDQKLVFPENVVLPIDFSDAGRFDIGPKTIELFRKQLAGAKTILWNGTLGKYEEPPYDTGSKEIMKSALAIKNYKIAGGGDALTLIQQLGVFNQFDLVSSGGGAMLAFLAGEELPGIKALQRTTKVS